MSNTLCTLALPEPFTKTVGAVAGITTLGHIPTTQELCTLLSNNPPDVLCPQLRDPITAAVMASAGTRLRGVCVYAVGFNNVDVEAATRLGIAVCNTPGVLTNATADCATGLILAAARRLAEGDRVLRAGLFKGWEPDFMLGLELNGATLGIVGLGRIGQAVARRALAFGMHVVHATIPEPPIDQDLADRVTPMPLAELLKVSDVVSLHCPLTPETRHLIDADALRAMKSTAILINTARGAIVDEPALVVALRDGIIGGAGLDVYEDEPQLAPGLATLENVVLSPHLGSATHHTRAAMAGLCANSTVALLEGRMPECCVNPEVAANATWLR